MHRVSYVSLVMYISKVIQHYFLKEAGEGRDSLAFVESLHCCLPLLVLEAKHAGEVSHVRLQQSEGKVTSPTSTITGAIFSRKAAVTPAGGD